MLIRKDSLKIINQACNLRIKKAQDNTHPQNIKVNNKDHKQKQKVRPPKPPQQLLVKTNNLDKFLVISREGKIDTIRSEINAVTTDTTVTKKIK